MAKKIKKANKKPPIVLVLLIIILLVPCLFLGAVVLQSLEDSSNPVVGSRYENELDPAIKEEDILKIEESLKELDGIENIEVNFKTARLSILINTEDDMSKNSIKKLVQKAYSEVDEVLEIDTYFTNYVKEDDPDTIIKMYDLQIDAYNLIEGDNKIHYVITKTGAQEERILQCISSPKDKEVANDVMNQDKGE